MHASSTKLTTTSTICIFEISSRLLTDSDDEEIEPPPSYRANMDRRRKSVFAESYEPGEEDAAVEKVGKQTDGLTDSGGQ